MSVIDNEFKSLKFFCKREQLREKCALKVTVSAEKWIGMNVVKAFNNRNLITNNLILITSW